MELPVYLYSTNKAPHLLKCVDDNDDIDVTSIAKLDYVLKMPLKLLVELPPILDHTNTVLLVDKHHS